MRQALSCWPKWAVIAIAVSLSLADVAAQNGIVTLYRKDHQALADTIPTGHPFTMMAFVNNNTGLPMDITNGWRLSSPDGAMWDSTTIRLSSVFNAYLFFGSNWGLVRYGADGIGSDTVGFFGAASGGPADTKLPVGWNDSAFAITAWFSQKGAAGKHICIDSSYYGYDLGWYWLGPPPDFTYYYP